MTLYVAICQDRHFDTVVRVFDTQEKAITYAKQFVKDCARHPDSIKESYVKGWLYHCEYSCEGDFVRVEYAGLNKNEYETEI